MKFTVRYKFWKVFLTFFTLAMLVMIGYGLNYYYSERNSGDEDITNIGSSATNGLGELLGFIYYLVFFYLSLNYFYGLIVKNKRFVDYLKVIGLLIGISFAYYLFLNLVFPYVLENKYDSIGKLLSAVIRRLIPIFIISYLFAYLTNMREAVKHRRILEAQKMQLEAQISQANFNFLKAQINPHFLHNTLNFLYAKSLPFSSELSEGILTLSDIMRYALGQGNQKDGKAPLKDEVEHVQNVIKISQLRYSHQLKVHFLIEGVVGDAKIIPFVLITIVENAFKHGELKNPDYPILISLKISDNALYFSCRNRKRTGMKQLSTGIGLDNIRKRLELAYGNQYEFIVHDEQDSYSTELTIKQL